ncbi:MAG: S-layer homology domain-containing protein [SAR324 cluster bacterium]|nr:S-layer homology domain-containing protein [SAR324 cluster bacterium]
MRNSKKWLNVSAIILFGLIMVACSSGPAPRPQQSTLDTPMHHGMRGRDMIRQERWIEARREFQLALGLQQEYAPGLAGMALLVAHSAQLPGKPTEQKNRETQESLNYLEQALEAAKTDEDKASVNTYGIRVRTFLQHEDWLEDAEKHYERAVDIYQNAPKLHAYLGEPEFYMAQAYQQALNMEKASQHFRTVLELNQNFIQEANQAMVLLDKIIRAQPASRHGKQISLNPAITRADMAALLIEELNLAELYQGRNPQSRDLSFKSPYKPFQNQETPVQNATDIMDHPLRNDMETVLSLKVRGLEANPQKLFYPDQPITRAEYAVMMEDILVRVTQDSRLSTKFVGEPSPWIDVRPDAFYYNAARTLVSRNIMEVVNKIRGEFGPEKTVNGADALLGIRLFREELTRTMRTLEN